MKQETLEGAKMNEELAWDLAKQSFKESEGREPDINDTERGELLAVSCLQEGILKGAKWQEERMYSEEQLKLAYMQGYNRGADRKLHDMESYIEFIKQNKKD